MRRANALHWKVEQHAAASIVRPAQNQCPKLSHRSSLSDAPTWGKSTLFNRLTGTRRSIVTNEPGITRDRIYGKAEWRGPRAEIVDTGGLVPDDKALIPQEILRQAHVAIKKAALLVLVVDSQAGLNAARRRIGSASSYHRQTVCGRPSTKVDAMSQESTPMFSIASAFRSSPSPPTRHRRDDLLDSRARQVSSWPPSRKK